MLKLTYTELGLHLERIDQSLEELVSQRSILALRIGESMCVQPGNISFLVPAQEIEQLLLEQTNRMDSAVSFCSVDEDFDEVSIAGTWISQHSQVAEGLFTASLADSTEEMIEQLWQCSQQQISTPRN